MKTYNKALNNLKATTIATKTQNNYKVVKNDLKVV